MRIICDRILHSERRFLKNTQFFFVYVVAIFGIAIMILSVCSLFGGGLEFFNQNFDKIIKLFITVSIAGTGVMFFCAIKIVRIDKILRFLNENRNGNIEILAVKRTSWIKNTWEVVREE